MKIGKYFLVSILCVCLNLNIAAQDEAIYDKFIFTSGTAAHFLLKSDNNKQVSINKGWIIENKNFDTIFNLQNCINPSVQLGINKIIKKTYISTIVLNFLRENYGYFNNNGLKIESSCYRLSVNLEGGYVIKIKDNRLIPKIVFSHNVLVLWENTHSGNIRYFNGFNSIDKHKELILIDISYMYPISTKLLVMPYVNLLLYDFSNTYKKIMFYQNYYSAYFNMGIMIGF